MLLGICCQLFEVWGGGLGRTVCRIFVCTQKQVLLLHGFFVGMAIIEFASLTYMQPLRKGFQYWTNVVIVLFGQLQWGWMVLES